MRHNLTASDSSSRRDLGDNVTDNHRINSEMLPVSQVVAPKIINGRPTKTCPECGRVFDALNPVDCDELAYGHDCEVPA